VTPQIQAKVQQLRSRAKTTKSLKSSSISTVVTGSLEEELQKELTMLEQKRQSFTRITNGDSLVFYYKMLGDHHRYLAEFHVDSEAEKSKEAAFALGAYYIGTEIAKLHLSPTNPIRLGLAFNLSVFYYEIMTQPGMASQLAKDAFDGAIADLSQLHEEDSMYKDCTLLMQLLKDNLTTWTYQ